MALSRTGQTEGEKQKNLNIIAVAPAWLTRPTNTEGEKTRKPRRTRAESLSGIFTKSVLAVVNDSFSYSKRQWKKIKSSCSNNPPPLRPPMKRGKTPTRSPVNDTIVAPTACTRYSQKCRFASFAWRAIRAHNSCLWHVSRVCAPE